VSCFGDSEWTNNKYLKPLWFGCRTSNTVEELERHIYHENFTLIMESFGLESPQGQRTLTFWAESPGFFLGLTLCPDSWLFEAATVFVGSCIFLETGSKKAIVCQGFIRANQVIYSCTDKSMWKKEIWTHLKVSSTIFTTIFAFGKPFVSEATRIKINYFSCLKNSNAKQ